MAAKKIEKKLMADLPQLDKDRIDDLIVGNANARSRTRLKRWHV